jgi:metal-responsive CopG/Arc/MetJ family transcriptional regulator
MSNSQVRHLAKRSATWKTVQLPEDLLNKVDGIVKIRELGYASRGEFVREAVRLRVEQIEEKLKK